MKILIPRSCLPSKWVCMNKSTVRSWQMKGKYQSDCIWAEGRPGPVPSLCRVLLPWQSHRQWILNLLRFPKDHSSLVLNLVSVQRLTVTTDTRLRWYLFLTTHPAMRASMQGVPIKHSGATHHPVFCEGSIRTPICEGSLVFHSHPPSRFSLLK